jgi:hypothetical protein
MLLHCQLSESVSSESDALKTEPRTGVAATPPLPLDPLALAFVFTTVAPKPPLVLFAVIVGIALCASAVTVFARFSANFPAVVVLLVLVVVVMVVVVGVWLVLLLPPLKVNGLLLGVVVMLGVLVVVEMVATVVVEVVVVLLLLLLNGRFGVMSVSFVVVLVAVV